MKDVEEKVKRQNLLLGEKFCYMINTALRVNMKAQNECVILDRFDTNKEFFISILITGTLYGEYIVALNESTAAKLMQKMDSSFTTTGLKNDLTQYKIFIGEFLNIVVGDISTELKDSETVLSITTPKLYQGHVLYPELKVGKVEIHPGEGFDDNDNIECYFYLDNMRLSIAEIYKGTLERLYYKNQQLKDANKKLVQQQKQIIHAEKLASLGTLSSGVAHNINNPLTTISLSANRMEKELKKDEFRKNVLQDSLGKIKHTTDRISKIIKSLRSFSKSALLDDFEEITIHSLVRKSLKDFVDPIKEGAIQLRINLNGKDNEVIRCGPIEMINAVGCLLKNSIEAVIGLEEKERWIQLDINMKKKGMLLNLSNGGPMIDINFAEKAFDPFFTTKDPSYSGLGLSLVKGVVESHSGTVELGTKGSHTNITLWIPSHHLKSKKANKKKEAS